MSLKGAALAAPLLALALVPPAYADQSSGVDAALFRPSYDNGGVFSLEGARLGPKRDISMKMLLGFAKGPLDVTVPGIGDGDVDNVLDFTLTLDTTIGFVVSKRLAIGLAAAVYRTDTGPGYGQRDGYQTGNSDVESTGMISLRDLSNLDPSGGYEAQSLSGPLDVRVGAKYLLVDGEKLAATLVGTVVLPFGEDEMYLGDSNLVFEPRVAIDYRFDRLHSTKVVLNAGARIRQRTVLQAYDPMMADAEALSREEAAKAVLDIGSEAIIGAGYIRELSPEFNVAAEAVALVPLPSSVGYGSCELFDGAKCSALTDADYAGDDAKSDLAAYAVAGVTYRMNAHMTANLAGSAGFLGARGDDFRFMAGVVWSPQPESEARVGRGDRDGDGLPDLSDGCAEDAEDKDGYQDDDGCPDLDNDGDGVIDVDDRCADEPEDRDTFEDDDGCPERDNDNDGIQDVADRCPDDPEDVDGFEDDDGCSDEDNDGDGFADKQDRCPNDAEIVNGVDDDDGCPDTRATTGPIEAGDRIDLRGNRIEFTAGSATLTPASKVILNQVAQLMKDKNLSIRVETHVALGTKSKAARAIADQKKKDKTLSQRRADAIFAYLQSQGVPAPQITGAVGLGSDRPLGASTPTDGVNDRTDFIKTQQRTP